MTRIKLILFSFVLAVFVSTVRGQAIGDYSKEEISELSQKVEDQIRFLEFYLNTVGSEQTSARDKDVIIRDSYKKIFRDGQVQVEDDLLVDRNVITNKDVTSYLKDVEFFFKDAVFKFKIREITPSLKDNNELYFQVSMDRTLTATGINDEEIENTQPRFAEINFDRNANELKIASIYTTKLSRDKELAEWWETLSYEWSTYFRNKFDFREDSLTMEQIYKISSIDSLDLSGNMIIQDLTPIHALRELKYVNISNTSIQELNPISNVTFLSYLDISHTPTEDIQFIKYSERLTYLDISHTQVKDIEELKNLVGLRHLDAAHTPLQSFGVLNAFTALESLDLEESGFSNLENIQELKSLKDLNLKANYLINLEFISGLEQLEHLNLEETNVMDLAPLSELKQLKTLRISGTEISNLDPLNGLENLEKIYADQTDISGATATNFTRKNRNVLLIHNVGALQEWWNTLPGGWKEVFVQDNPELSKNPSVEALYTLVGAESLDLSGSAVISLRPISEFKKITTLVFNDTKVHDMSPLSEMKTLKSIIGNNSAITNLQALVHLESLDTLKFQGTNITAVSPLTRLKNLKYLNIDDTEVPVSEVRELVKAAPEAVVVFRTKELQAWWQSLDGSWKEVLNRQFELNDEPSSEELHKMTASPKVVIHGADIHLLEPLLAFLALEVLDVFNVPLADISPVAQMDMLQNLRISQAPFRELDALSSLENLKTLDVSNTGIDDLRPLSSLRGLEVLNLSGTGIRRLKGLEGLSSLRELDIASTNVRSLNPIMDLTNMEKLACFNTRINNRQVNNFKAANPDCEVRYY